MENDVRWLFNPLALIAQTRGNYASARGLYSESLLIARDMGNEMGMAASLKGLGYLALSEGNLGDARESLEESFTLYSVHGHREGMARCLTHLGDLARVEGDVRSARRCLEEAVQLARLLRNDSCLAWAFVRLARVARAEGSAEWAEMTLRDAIERGRRLRDSVAAVEGLEVLAGTHCDRGKVELAVKVFRVADDLRGSVGAFRPYYCVEDYERDLSSCQEILGGERFEAAWAAGASLTTEEVVRSSTYWSH